MTGNGMWLQVCDAKDCPRYHKTRDTTGNDSRKLVSLLTSAAGKHVFPVPLTPAEITPLHAGRLEEIKAILSELLLNDNMTAADRGRVLAIAEEIPLSITGLTGVGKSYSWAKIIGREASPYREEENNFTYAINTFYPVEDVHPEDLKGRLVIELTRDHTDMVNQWRCFRDGIISNELGKIFDDDVVYDDIYDDTEKITAFVEEFIAAEEDWFYENMSNLGIPDNHYFSLRLSGNENNVHFTARAIDEAADGDTMNTGSYTFTLKLTDLCDFSEGTLAVLKINDGNGREIQVPFGQGTIIQNIEKFAREFAATGKSMK